MFSLSRISSIFVKRRGHSSSRLVSSIALASLCVSSVLLPGSISRSADYEPIGIVSDETLVTGQPLPCQVNLDGPSATVTVYSNPPGAVSFQGTVQNGAIFEASTDPNLTHGQNVTVYAITDGQTVVATTTAVYSDNAPEMPEDL